MLWSTAFAILTAALISIAFTRLRRRTRKYPHHRPPGPSPLPIIGNLHQLPKHNNVRVYRDWSETYGSDIISIRVLGREMYVLNSKEAMNELLDRRSSIYSSKTSLTMINESGWANAVPLLPYGPRLKTCRRLLQKGLGPAAVKSYVPYLNRECAFYLERLLDDPERFVKHFTQTAARISLKIAYGYEGVTEDTELLDKAVEAMDVFCATARPGLWLVDAMPFLRHIPAWFPGATFKKLATKWRKTVLYAINHPFAEVKRHVVEGTAGGSFTSVLLQTESLKDPITEDCIKHCAFGIFAGQFDTTTAAMSWFVLAMAMHPEVQKKAQGMVDKVVGTDRLPQVEDKDSLPFVVAIMKEVFRWHNILPLIAHSTSEDDEYRGYYVPAGTPMLANVWAVTHDESIYPNPDQFIPERHLEEGTFDPTSIIFGFGRRKCPGKDVGQALLFALMACTLQNFDIAPAQDEHGNTLPLVAEGMPGVINFPKPFKCSIRPRSGAHTELIRKSVSFSKTLPDMLEIFAT